MIKNTFVTTLLLSLWHEFEFWHFLTHKCSPVSGVSSYIIYWIDHFQLKWYFWQLQKLDFTCVIFWRMINQEWNQDHRCSNRHRTLFHNWKWTLGSHEYNQWYFQRGSVHPNLLRSIVFSSTRICGDWKTKTSIFMMIMQMVKNTREPVC